MKLQNKKLSNGITLIHEPRNLPIVSLSITNKFGAAYEESKIKGIAHFIEHLLFTGTKTRSHENISREIEKKGGLLNAFTNHETTSFWFKLPSEHIFSGLDILTDMLNNPSFNEKKFEKEKKVVLEEIKMYHDMPHRHVYELLEKNMFDSPLGEGIIGSKETVSSLTRDFVVRYFKQNYSPENYIVTIVGQTDFEKVAEYLEKKFNPKNKSPKIIPIKTKNAETTETREGIDQAHFVLAFHAPPLDSHENNILEVLDAYIANGMSSRLFLEIREKRGLAYTVNSSLSGEKNYSIYTIYVGTTHHALPQVKELIIKEFENIDSMTPQDLQEAKQRLIGLKQVTSEESSSVMNELMYAELISKAEDYYEYENQISKVTLEEVKSLAKKSIKEFSTAAIVPK